MTEEIVYIRTAGFILYRISHNRIEYLLLQPNKKAKEDVWGPPKGHLDHDDEQLLEAAKRETLEETGINENEYTIHLDFHKTIRFLNKFGRPKTLDLWPARLNNPVYPVTISHEHKDHRWLHLDAALNISLDRFKESFAEVEMFIKQKETKSE